MRFLNRHQIAASNSLFWYSWLLLLRIVFPFSVPHFKMKPSLSLRPAWQQNPYFCSAHIAKLTWDRGKNRHQQLFIPIDALNIDGADSKHLFSKRSSSSKSLVGVISLEGFLALVL